MGFQEFRKVWLIPEAYPIILSAGLAVGLGGYLVTKKLFRDPAVAMTREERLGSIPAQYANGRKNVDQKESVWSRWKYDDPVVFGKADGVNKIMRWKFAGSPSLKDYPYSEEAEA
eukprot:CAMPEP_0182447146 /NCGR_PEP_ID=MMETSP1172-20130603/12023_1 /TAXON_ID=708627 /ORGANISM="Timspurckia oligopyrenoides, Strain CCMP3278" /LENGTH=114 /DNA_ID=CAMNT_0024643463 /DNA_START=64 /DNA_END=408 /DNA_ORIENTATION=+